MSTARAELIAELKSRVRRIEGATGQRRLPTHPVLAGMLELESGRVYRAHSPGAALLLLAGPSSAGSWCAVVGLPRFGLEAAVEVGVVAERLVMVPHVDTEDLPEVVAALVDVVDVVLCGPLFVAPRTLARLAARIRERGSVLVTLGDWERAAASLAFRDTVWSGVGSGHGHLQSRQVTLQILRPGQKERTRRIWFPDEQMRIRRVDPSALRSVP